ncbi:hypothetical protein D3C72_1330080 [compost metagenome]
MPYSVTLDCAWAGAVAPSAAAPSAAVVKKGARARFMVCVSILARYGLLLRNGRCLFSLWTSATSLAQALTCTGVA